MGHRPNDYHPDHRAVGQLVQDASYMVTVPFFCPDTPHLERNPVFLFVPGQLHQAQSDAGGHRRVDRRRRREEDGRG